MHRQFPSNRICYWTHARYGGSRVGMNRSAFAKQQGIRYQTAWCSVVLPRGARATVVKEGGSGVTEQRPHGVPSAPTRAGGT